jgi:hypothetical protein
MKNDLPKRKTFYEKLYNSKDLAPGLLEYNYNVLMSVEKNGILITNGDNDTYPALLLQDVFDIRDDVTIINISLMQHLDGYLESRMERKNIDVDFERLPDKKDGHFLYEFASYIVENEQGIPFYFALTVYQDFLKQMDGKLHITGLAYKFKPGECDNLALIKKNIERLFRLDYLTYNWYDDHFVAKKITQSGLNMNYVVPMLMLAEHYKRSEDVTKSDRLKRLVLTVGKNANRVEQVEHYIAEKGL